MSYRNLRNLEIDVRPCKDSDAGIGIAFETFAYPDVCYGKWCAIAYWGRYAVSISQKHKKPFTCNYFACGCGG